MGGILGTNVICQVGLVVRDIAKTAAAWADLLGVPVPAVILSDPLEQAHTQHRGRPTEARAKLAFFQCGPQLSLELIEPIGRPSTWGEFLDTCGEGVHHIAFKVQGTDGVIAELDARGMGLIQKGDYTGGRYAYVDAAGQLKVILELLEDVRRPSQAGS